MPGRTSRVRAISTVRDARLLTLCVLARSCLVEAQPPQYRRSVTRSYVREARRRVGPKRDRVALILAALAVEHADAGIALAFANDLELLVSVMLSAQTTDVNVNRVTETLFKKYRRPEDYLAVSQEELERDIFQTGFFRQKAKSLRGTMRILIEEFDGQVPERFDDLLRLPGVARKTANVVCAERGEAQGIVVDTHVRRISQRLGFTRQEDPVKIERDLIKIVPRADWARFPHLLIWHGRRICDARKPDCASCPIAGLCPSSRVEPR
ncbi:MAG: endonuclease III [Actinobacteria bacterium]|nr:endonuclease III [Actinomycetota bacterium]